MPVLIFFLTRFLLIGSLVFVLGYVFGNFSKNAVLTRITKIASIFLVASFLATSFFMFRGVRGGYARNFSHNERVEGNCNMADSTYRH